MIESVNVIGARGRVGSAVSGAPRRARRHRSATSDADARPPLRPRPRDRRRSPRRSSPARGSAHVSGGTPLAALDAARTPLLAPPAADVHARPWPGAARRRLGGRHGRDRGGACGREPSSPRSSGSGRSRSHDDRRALYHAGAAIASNYLVTLRRARRRAARGGRRTTRGARPAHASRDRQRLRADGPDRARRLGDRRAAPSRRSPRPHPTSSPPTTSWRASPHVTRCRLEVARDRRTHRRGRPGRARRATRRNGRSRADDGRAPRGASRPARRGARALRHGRDEPLRQPGAVRRAGRPERLPARRAARPRSRTRGGRRRRLRAAGRRDVPARLPDLDRGDRARSDRWKASTARATSAASRRSASSCSTIVRPDLAFFGQKDAQQVAVLRRMVADLNLELELVVVPTVRDAGRARALVAQRPPLAGGARPGARPAAGARHRRSRDGARDPGVGRHRRRVRRGRAVRPAHPRRRRPRRHDPPDRQRPSRATQGGIVSTRPRTPAPGTPAPGKLPDHRAAR